MENIRSILRNVGSQLTSIWRFIITFVRRRRTIETKVSTPPSRPKLVLQVKGIRTRTPWKNKTPAERQRIHDYLQCEARFMMSRRTTLYRPFPH